MISAPVPADVFALLPAFFRENGGQFLADYAALAELCARRVEAELERAADAAVEIAAHRVRAPAAVGSTDRLPPARLWGTRAGIFAWLYGWLPEPRVWPGLGIVAEGRGRLRVAEQGLGRSVVLVWERSALGRPPADFAVPAPLIPPGVRVQAALVDRCPSTTRPPVGRRLRGRVFWETLASTRP